MTYFLLIRHGLHTVGPGVMLGRTPGIHLSAAGNAQAQALAARLSPLQIGAIYSSPLDRTKETARFIADNFRLPVITEPDLIELDYGEWTGRTVQELRTQPRWELYNSFRSGMRVPNGESMLEVQTRAVNLMTRLRDRHSGEFVVLVSHADVIKLAVAYFLGVAVDLFQRIEISPASVTFLGLNESTVRIFCINETGGLPPIE